MISPSFVSGAHECIGQLAWIAEKFAEWSDSGARPGDAIDRDLLQTNVMLYRLTGTAGSSAGIYYEREHAPQGGARPEPSSAPTALAVFPRENYIPLRHCGFGFPRWRRPRRDYREPMRLLLISGSLRDGSTNTATLRSLQEVAPPGVDASVYDGTAALPHFNPDDDREGEPVHPAVADLRAAIADADAVVVCTPEYAGALPGALKNLLEWTVGDGGLYGKPVAWLNVAGPAAPTGGADAHASLAKVLALSLIHI